MLTPQRTALLAGALLLGAPQLSAQLGQLIYESEGSYSYEYYGRDGKFLGDVNGDGYGDFTFQAERFKDALIVSGRDGSVLYRFADMEVFPVGDLNLDGCADFAVDRNVVAIHSGLDGSELYELSITDCPESVGIDDIDQDGFPDFAVGQPAFPSGPSSVNVYSGITGNLILQLNPGGDGTQFGRQLAAMGDLTGDGLPELAVGSAPDGVSRGRMEIFSLIDQRLLTTWKGTRTSSSYVGEYELESGDVNADGILDIAFKDGKVGGGYRFIVLSGADFSVLHDIPESTYADGTRYMAVGDINGDGFADIMASALSSSFFGNSACGAIWAYSGRTGEVMDRIEGRYRQDVLRVFGAGDINGDGFDDILAHANAGTSTQSTYTSAGAALVYSGGLNPLLTASNTDAGSRALFTVTAATPNGTVVLAYSLNGPGPYSTAFGLASLTPPLERIPLKADGTGVADYAVTLPPQAQGLQVWLQAADLSAALLTNPVDFVIG